MEVLCMMTELKAYCFLDDEKYKLKKCGYKIRKNTDASRSKTYNDNNIITLDTETTSIKFVDKDGAEKKASFVYIGMMCINGRVWKFRYLSELKWFLDSFNDEAINVIYVHNLGFDFTFLQNTIPFEKVFARVAHKPIFARYKNWEFRCSYFLSQMSLDKVCKEYKLNASKLTGTFDYEKIRTPETELTLEDELYCEYDVLSLYEYIKIMLNENEGKYKNIPYTQTGFVRRLLLENAKRDKEYYKLRKTITDMTPDEKLFLILESAFAGGYTHANFESVACGTIYNVYSFDLTSSYPAVMCRKKFPMGKFVEKIKNFEKYIADDGFRCVFKAVFSRLNAKSKLAYISKHKCLSIDKGVDDNGRIIKAEKLSIYITDIDYDSICKMYTFKHVKFSEFYASKADYLPKTIIKSILQLYSNKTVFKGIEEKADIYLKSKQMVNAVYGCCVMNPFTDDIIYNNCKWITETPAYDKLVKYYENKKTILAYQWGVFVTAYARNILVQMCSIIPDNVHYMDTDSIKFSYKKNMRKFEKMNELIHAENVMVAEKLGFDFSLYCPVDKFGNAHELGLWDYEGKYDSAKFLGAKRYCVYMDGKIKPTVAGCPVNAMKAYLKKHGCDKRLEPFRLNMELNEYESGKNTHLYHENYDIDIDVTDCNNVTCKVHIGYGCYIEKTGFVMSFGKEYYLFLTGEMQIADKKIMKRNGVMV